MSAILLSKHVLVLNRLWQAVNICTVRRAIGLLYQGHAMAVVEENGRFHTFTFDDWCDFSRFQDGDACLHTVRYQIALPKIILLSFYDRLPRLDVKFTRHNILERDHNTCQYCGRTFDRRELNLDHVIPRDLGGRTTWANIVTSCHDCNSKKGNRSPRQAGLRLIRKPKKPVWRPYSSFALDSAEQDSWRRFIDIAYWNVELGQDEPAE